MEYQLALEVNLDHVQPKPKQNASGSGSATWPKKKTKTSHACRECKRLKLKCDKKFPCSSCVKRGCSSICPDGVLVTGRGSRFVLSGSEQLHEKIDILTERVRTLEVALERLQIRVNPLEKHPLLGEELLKIKTKNMNPGGGVRREKEKSLSPELEASEGLGGDVRERSREREESEEQEEGPVDQSGTLTIGDRGSSTYFGSTARSEYFIHASDDPTPSTPSTIPPQILLNAHAFPLNLNLSLPDSHSELSQQLHAQLPPLAESERLCGIYRSRVSWLYDPLPSSTSFLATLRTELYSPTPSFTPDLHRLSLLYTIHALGHLHDLDTPPYSHAAWRSFDLAKACLATRSILDPAGVGISCIQAIFLMCVFTLMGNKKPDPAWTLMGIAVKLAQSIGLHRDDFQLTAEETQERRLLWWEIVSLEGWMALGFGRPPSVQLSTVNCKFPEYTDSSGYRGWAHLFGRTCLPPILDIGLGVKTPPYGTVEQTEEQVKKSAIPPMLEIAQHSKEKPSAALTFQRAMVVTARALTILKLHLGWFTQALNENPTDLRKSRYFASVEAVHLSACTLVASLHHMTAEEFPMVCRFGLFWSNTLSSAVPLCLIATRSPSSELAAHSLKEVEHCYEIFSRGASAGSHPATVGLAIVERLRNKARQSMLVYADSEGMSRVPSEYDHHDEGEDELERLGGKTKLVRGSSRGAMPAFEPQPQSQPYASSTTLQHPVSVQPSYSMADHMPTDASPLDYATAHFESVPPAQPQHLSNDGLSPAVASTSLTIADTHHHYHLPISRSPSTPLEYSPSHFETVQPRHHYSTDGLSSAVASTSLASADVGLPHSQHHLSIKGLQSSQSPTSLEHSKADFGIAGPQHLQTAEIPSSEASTSLGYSTTNFGMVRPQHIPIDGVHTSMPLRYISNPHENKSQSVTPLHHISQTNLEMAETQTQPRYPTLRHQQSQYHPYPQRQRPQHYHQQSIRRHPSYTSYQTPQYQQYHIPTQYHHPALAPPGRQEEKNDSGDYRYIPDQSQVAQKSHELASSDPIHSPINPTVTVTPIVARDLRPVTVPESPRHEVPHQPRWPLHSPEQPNFPPHTPVHGHLQGNMNGRGYDLQPDYINAPMDDHLQYNQQQQLWTDMVQQLHRDG